MAKFADIFKGTAGTLAQKAKQSLAWMKRVINSMMGRTSPFFQPDDKSFVVSTPQVGSMYMFQYRDPRFKAVLPFYDQFPLIFFIKPVPLEEGAGFMGLNLHYLPPIARAILMDSLDAIKNNDKYDDTTKLLISYEYLSKYASQFPDFERCIKKYYFNRVTDGEFYYVSPADWAYVVTLPLQQWVVNPNKKYAKSPPY